MKIALAIALLVGCTTYVPMPAAQAPKQPVAVAAPIVVHNLAVSFAADIPLFAKLGLKCVSWTGRETAIAGVDSCMVIAPTQIIYCEAPSDAKPSCSPAFDWTPQPEAEKQTPKPKVAPSRDR